MLQAFLGPVPDEQSRATVAPYQVSSCWVTLATSPIPSSQRAPRPPATAPAFIPRPSGTREAHLAVPPGPARTTPVPSPSGGTQDEGSRVQACGRRHPSRAIPRLLSSAAEGGAILRLLHAVHEDATARRRQKFVPTPHLGPPLKRVGRRKGRQAVPPATLVRTSRRPPAHPMLTASIPPSPSGQPWSSHANSRRRTSLVS